MDDVVWAGGERWRRLPGMSRILGLAWRVVASEGIGYAGTDPLAGGFLLRDFWFHAYANPRASNSHALGMGLCEQVPTSEAEFDAGESLLPFGATGYGVSRRIWIGQRYEGLRVPWGKAVVCGGRRLVASFRNGSTASSDAFLGVVAEELERVPADDVGEISRPGIMGALSAAAAAARGS